MGNPSGQEPVFGIDAMLLWWPLLEQGLSGVPRGISGLRARAAGARGVTWHDKGAGDV